MLAPPPGGTFDAEDSSLPLRNPLKDADGAEITRDSPDEKVPLLTEHAHSNSSSHQVERGKVRKYVYLCMLYCQLSLQRKIYQIVLIHVYETKINKQPD